MRCPAQKKLLKLLERPACAYVPAPVLFKVAAGATFKVQIDMVVATCLDSRADTIFKPGIFKAAVYLDACTAAVGEGGIVAAAEFVQQVGFDVDIGFGVYILADVEAQTPKRAADAALG